jgi:hypothetical protein
MSLTSRKIRRGYNVPQWFSMVLVGIGENPGFTQRVHQQALDIGPFSNTCEADAVSPEEAKRGLHDRDLYNQGNIKWI